MSKVLTCPHCGSEEFTQRAAAQDILRFVDGAPEIIRAEAHDFLDFDGITCNECGEDAPPLETKD